jgi:non-specific serine/threonine protein kinase
MSAHESEDATRLAAALWRFWHLRGHEPEGKRRLIAAVDANERPSKARAFALIGLSGMSAGQGDLETARRHAEDALALYRGLDDAWGIAYALETLGYIASYHDRTAARTLLEESMERFRQIGDVHFELVAARNLAWVHTELGDPDRGVALHEEILRKARDTNNPRMEAASLQSLAYHAIDRRDLGVATEMLRAAFNLDRDIGDVPAIALDLLTLGRLLLVWGHPTEAAMVLGRMRGIAEETGAPVEEAYAVEYEARAKAELGEAAYADAVARGRNISTDEAIATRFETVGG